MNIHRQKTKQNSNHTLYTKLIHKVKVKSLSCVQLFVTAWTAAHQAPLSMGFSRQEYWSGLPLSPPRLPMLLLLLSHFSHVRLCATPQMAAHQAPLSLGFSRQEHWNGLPFPSPGYLPDPGIEPLSPTLAGGFLTT